MSVVKETSSNSNISRHSTRMQPQNNSRKICEFSRSPLIFPCWCECVCVCTMARICWGETERKNCDLICYSHRGNPTWNEQSWMCLYVHLGRQSAFLIPHMKLLTCRTSNRKNVNFPMSRLLNICIWCVCTYDVLFLMVLYIAHWMGFSTMTKIHCYLFISFKPKIYSSASVCLCV